MLAIEHLLDRRPKALSGGQRQRVALGRAIVREPRAFLMDEPLSNLDAKLRVHTRAEISALHKRLGVTTVYVTHDQTEAMTMADRIVIMRDGEIQQIADPDTMFAKPANLFVANFIGSPGMNILRATPSLDGGAARRASSGTRSGCRSPRRRPRRSPAGRSSSAFGRSISPRVRVRSRSTSCRGSSRVGSEKYVYVDVPPENRSERAPPAATRDAAMRSIARLIDPPGAVSLARG